MNVKLLVICSILTNLLYANKWIETTYLDTKYIQIDCISDYYKAYSFKKTINNFSVRILTHSL